MSDMSSAENKIMSAMYDTAVQEYLADIRNRILNGEVVSIPGIGKISLKYRRVKNPMGREFSIKPKIDVDPTLDRDILKEYTADPTKYDFSNKKRKYNKQNKI